MSLYPLKFTPIIKSKIWGGERLEKLYDKIYQIERNGGVISDEEKRDGKFGESWEISDIEGDISVVNNGYLAENDLREMIELYMGDLVGDPIYNRFGLGFPLLIKFIDANEDLSVQVHPDDELAYQLYGQQGKNELWYVVDCEPGAGLYVGFKKGVKRADYEKAVKEGYVDKLLVFYPVQKGDTFFIPAGTVHAIGKGVMVAEIQQASDCTYRIFDWNRTDDNGNQRELHCAEALQAIHFNDKYEYKLEYEEKENSSSKLFRSKYFNINILNFEKPIQKVYVNIESFIIYMCIEGEVHLFNDDIHEVIYAGETILVPAILPDINLVPNGKSKVLEIYMPEQEI